MDCCNYVQPYSSGTTGHFYHQQNFYYENMNGYAAYSMTPASNAIESNVRYNRLPPAYPTDYVYNPKEARLRKAMREQSRELSRQSILQTAIASASASGTGNVSNSGVVTSSSFLNHPLTCSSSPATASPSSSSLQNSPSINSGRIINPWFPVGPTSSSTHLKPIISPRIMAAHQRTLEKTKEAMMRKQVECATAGVFNSGSNNNPSTNSVYGPEFSSHNPNAASASAGGSSPNDYCIIAEFGDGQKWHPYQNGGMNPYHNRGASMSKVGLHQNPNIHGPWAQFCGLPLQNSAAVQNPVIRPSRQMVFLQEQQQQQQQQHCGFVDEMQMQAYVQNKIDMNPRLHSVYNGQEGDPQAKNSVSPPQMQQLQDEVKCGEAVSSHSWETSSVSANNVVNSLLQDPLQQQDNQEEEPITADDEPLASLRQKPSCKQPLPGFHQAFGSTEIGRFSRSEFFANMVGESSNTIPEAYLPAPVFPFSPTTQSVIGSSIADEDMLQIMPEECYWLGATGPSPFNQNHSIENATVFGLSLISPNYAAFLDYSHRISMNQDWINSSGSSSSSATAQELQAAYIEQPSIFHHDSNGIGGLFGHEHLNLNLNLNYGNYPSYPNYDQHGININNNNNDNNNRRIVNANNSLINDLNFKDFIQSNEQMANSKQTAAVLQIKQNDRLCVLVEANQPKIEKDVI